MDSSTRVTGVPSRVGRLPSSVACGPVSPPVSIVILILRYKVTSGSVVLSIDVDLVAKTVAVRVVAVDFVQLLASMLLRHLSYHSDHHDLQTDETLLRDKLDNMRSRSLQNTSSVHDDVTDRIKY